MHAGRFVFSELIAHLPHKEFHKCVALYHDGPQPRKFSYWDQYLAMAFAQLTYRTRLSRMGFVEAFEGTNYNEGPYVAYRLLTAGEDWLLENQDKLELRISGEPSGQQRMPSGKEISDDDVPF